MVIAMALKSKRVVNVKQQGLTKIEQRQVQVMRMYLQGMTQHQIAVDLGINLAQVCHYLQKIREVWKSQYVRDYDEKLHQELAKIDNLELVCWQAYEESKKGSKVSKSRLEQLREKVGKIDGRTYKGKPKLQPYKQVSEITEEDNAAGDVRFLQQVAWCIETRSKILGLYKEQVTNNNLFLNWDAFTEGVAADVPDVIEAKVIIAESKLPPPESNGNGQATIESV